MLVLVCLLAGCAPAAVLTPTTAPAAGPLPAHVAGTVGEFAALVGGSDLVVQGYGLVAGLGTNGSREVPASVRQYFEQLLMKSKELATDSGGHFSPGVVLEDLDTAVVNLWGVIPAGAPVGTRFDVMVACPPETQTRSLDGGVMFLPADMSLAVPGELAGRQSKVYAQADGTIFVNPFLDIAKTEDIAKLREGRIIGGGRVLEARLLRL